MPKGYTGRSLRVDLTSGKIETIRLPEDDYRGFWGGYGLAVKYITDSQAGSRIDPLGPDNILSLCPGLLTGTGALFSGRFMVAAKSPLTGGWGDANCGGKLGPELKKAGFDAIFLHGRSPRPVVLVVRDGEARLEDAADLWGRRDAVETEADLRRATGEPKLTVAAIGAGGERLSLISGIVNDGGRIAARSGLGAVMGSKRLKAIAVRGMGSLDMADPELLKRANDAFAAELFGRTPMDKVSRFLIGHMTPVGALSRRLPFVPRAESVQWKQILLRYGTSGINTFSAESGDTPVKNWGGVGCTDFPIRARSRLLSGDRVIERQDRKYGCADCPIRCGGHARFDGPRGSVETHKPEYETCGSFGTLLLNDDLESIFHLNEILNRAGLDTISAGGVVAFAIECFENGILTESDTGGLRLHWGDADAILALTKKIVAREGIGDLLADGVKRAAEKIGRGSERFAVHAGGQELPMHDSRFEPTFGTAYCSEPTPGRHTIASATYAQLMNLDRLFPERVRKIPPLAYKAERGKGAGRGRMQATTSAYVQAANALGMCLFGLQTGHVPLRDWIRATTGWEVSGEELLTTGERIEALRQLYNLAEGIRPSDFRLHDRAAGHPPLATGPNAGVALEIETMQREFFEALGWDPQTGEPSRERLATLGLSGIPVPRPAANSAGPAPRAGRRRKSG